MPQHFTITATVHPSKIKPGGRGVIRVSVHVNRGYHLQSAHPLDKYLLPTKLSAKPVPALKFGAPTYPKARIITVSKEMSPKGKLAVYVGRVVMRLPFTVAAGAAPGPRTIHVQLLSQACNARACSLPEFQKATVHITVPPRTGGPAPKSPNHPNIVKRRPTKSSSAMHITPTVSSSSASASAASQLAWIKAQQFQIGPGEPLPALLAFALLGGMILNIMPCVLPVIPVKVLAMVQHAHGRRAVAVAHSLVFSAGIIFFFAALGLALGLYHLLWHGQVLYGGQFQQPWFVVALAFVVLALALSMLGVWTISAPRAVTQAQPPTQGYFGSFMMGTLATLLATPCSAPYLGPVIAFAFSNSLAISVLMMAVIGVGMAIPYVVLAAFPQLLARLPRAGRWSELFKQFLGLVMVAVAIFLLNELKAPPFFHWAMYAALILAAVCWAWGNIPNLNMEPVKIWSIRAASVLIGGLVAFGLYTLMGISTATAGTTSGHANAVVRSATPAAPVSIATPLRGPSVSPRSLTWQPFSVPRLRAGLAAGRMVVVDWSAVWCTNCRVLTATVLDTSAARRLFRANHAVLLRASLSGENPVATALLIKLGSHSIPFLAVFSPRQPLRPVLVPDRYTFSQLQRALARARTR